MSAFNQQQVQNAFTQSVALQAAQAAASGFTDFPSLQSALRTAQIQAEGAAGLQQQQQANALAQAQHSVAQQQLDATKTLTKTLDDLSKQLLALQQGQKDAITGAQVTAANAIVRAQDTFGRAQIGADAFDATTTRLQHVVRLNGKPFIVDDPTTFTGENLENIPLGGLVGQQKAAADALSRGLDKGFDADRQRQKAFDDQLQQAQQKFFDEQIKLGQERAQDPEGKFRTKQEQAFDEAERGRRKDQRDADKAHLEEQKRIQREIDTLEELRALRGELGRPNTLNFQKVVPLETGVDFLAVAARELMTRGRGGL